MDNRSEILRIALELFANRGYDAVGVQEISTAAGVTKPTLYHYFGSKLGLLKLLLDLYNGELEPAIQAAANYQGDLPLSLEQFAQAYVAFARRQPVVFRLSMTLAFAPRQSEAHQAAAAWNAALWQSLEDMFAAAARDHGNMRGRQKLYTATFSGMLNTYIGLWLNGYGPLEDDFLLRMVHQFQHGIYS